MAQELKRSESFNNDQKDYYRKESDRSQLLEQLLLQKRVGEIQQQNIQTQSARSLIGWTLIWALIFTFIIVGVVCSVLLLQRQGLVPSYSDKIEVEHLRTRLNEKETALSKCMDDNADLYTKIEAPNILPVMNTQLCQPMVTQSDRLREHSEKERDNKDSELRECKQELRDKAQEIDDLKNENLKIMERVYKLDAQFNALVVKSEAEGDSCEGWLCNGVKMMYSAVKDITGMKGEKKGKDSKEDVIEL